MTLEERRKRILRGQNAAELLRQPILAEAAQALNRHCFELFVSAGDDTAGDFDRERAKRLVNGADALLDLLREWATDAQILQEEPHDPDV